MFKLLCLCSDYAGDVWVGLSNFFNFCTELCSLTVSNSQNPTSRSPLIPNLLVEAEDDRGVDLDFLAEVVKLFEEQEDLKPAIISAVEQMSQELSIMSMNDDYKPYLTVRSLYLL